MTESFPAKIEMLTEAKKILKYAAENNLEDYMLAWWVDRFYKKWTAVVDLAAQKLSDSMKGSCEIENYGTEGDFEYMKFCALLNDLDAFQSMTGISDSDSALGYFTNRTFRKFQTRYLLEALEKMEGVEGSIPNT